jgi:hypothetical protein
MIAAGLASLLPLSVAADSLPSGERTVGQAVMEPAYDDSTGQLVYLLTPSQLAPLSPTNPINNVNQKAAAPLFLIVYPPGTAGTFNCMGAPGNCPDHAGVVANLATTLFPGMYGTDPAAVPGHDHLVGVAQTGGDFNVPWHVYLEFFTPGSTVTHITTLAQLQTAWDHGTIARFQSGLGLDTGITFVCAVVSQAAYLAGTPVS